MKCEIKCPCRMRDYMDEDDCNKTPCDACCPLVVGCDEAGNEIPSRPLSVEEMAALARAAIGGGLL